MDDLNTYGLWKSLRVQIEIDENTNEMIIMSVEKRNANERMLLSRAHQVQQERHRQSERKQCLRFIHEPKIRTIWEYVEKIRPSKILEFFCVCVECIANITHIKDCLSSV